jgi:hypothetical protein
MTKLSASAAPRAGTLEQPGTTIARRTSGRILIATLVLVVAATIAVVVARTPATGPSAAAAAGAGRTRSGPAADVGMLDRTWADWYAPAAAPAVATRAQAASSVDPDIDIGLMDFAGR